jgi:hypothetical protein
MAEVLGGEVYRDMAPIANLGHVMTFMAVEIPSAVVNGAQTVANGTGTVSASPGGRPIGGSRPGGR